ncbi:aminoglycoside phosphotransferase [Mycobacteriaceae bacterium 1482268.1]|nr:aminoglycoside phosphotransferase [Mycobacteriaceae bacterium 1482268.1]
MQTRSGAEITVNGDVVVKLHRPGTDPRMLQIRLRIAAESGSFVSPIDIVPQRAGLRWRTSWPRVETVAPQPDHLPWSDAGRLLAALHSEPMPPHTPVHGWPHRLRRAVATARHNDVVRRAAASLSAQCWRAGSPDRPSTLVHGDWHLGQLGRRSPAEPWLLIDVDDLGVGDPAWDLARPAGFWAAGLIPDAEWRAFIDAYRGADGAAVPDADPWPVLEPFARAAVVQAAANHPDDDLLVAACARMD